MTTDEIIDGILEHEGSNAPSFFDPNDSGGRTSWGIAERSNPEAWVNGPPSKDEARGLYEKKYVAPFDALHGVVSEELRAVMVDDGVLSGQVTAKKRLQHLLRVTEDGVLGPQTVAMAGAVDQAALLKSYVKDRTVALVRLAINEPKNLKWLAGWVIRSLSFL